MRSFAKWAALSVAAMLIISVLSLAVLSTHTGQRMALRVAEALASSSEGGVSFGELEGSLLSEGRLQHIHLRDRDGTWLTIDDIRFAWHPLGLLSRKLDIQYLTVGRVDVMRKPVATEPPVESSGSSDMPLIALAAQRLEVSELVLREATGIAAWLKITGSADLLDVATGLSAQLTVTRLDEPGGELEARLTYRPETQHLDIAASASEPADGLVATLLDLPDAPPLSLALNGTGPLDTWRAQWSISANAQPFAVGGVEIDRAAQRHRIAATIEGYLEQILPASIAELLSGKTTANLIAFRSDDGRIDAERLTLSSDAMQVSAAGGLDPASSYIHGQLNAQVARSDGSAVALRLSPDEVISLGVLDVQLAVPDTRGPRRVEVAAVAQSITSSAGALARLEITGSGHQSGKQAFLIADLNLRAAVSGLESDVAGLAEAIGTAPELRVAGSVDQGKVTLDQITATLAAGELIGNASFADGALAAQANVSMTDLARLSALAGQPLGGKLDARTSLSFQTKSGDFTVAIDASGQDLHAVDERVSQLLSGTTRLSGQIGGSTAGALNIKDLKFAAHGVTATANGQIDDSTIAIDVAGQIADLAPLSPALTGSARMTAALKGPLSDFTSNLVLEGEQVTLHGRPVSTPTAKLEGRGSLSAHSGTLEMSAALADKKLSARTTFATTAEDTASVNDLDVSFGVIRAHGNVRTLANGTPVGQLTLDAPTLADIALLAGQPVDGTASLSVELSEDEGAPALAFSGRANAIRLGDIRLRGFQATGDFKNYLAAANGKAEVRLQNLTSDGLQIGDLRLDASGADGVVRFTTAANVNGGRVTAGGQVAQKADALDIDITQAALTKQSRSIRLAAPAKVSIADGTTRIDKLVLSAGSGSAEVSGTAGEQLAIDVTLRKLPVDIADAFVEALRLEGAIDGRITVRGTAAVPQADAQITWANAAAAATRAQHLPSLNIDLKARLAGQNVTATVTARGPDRLAVTVDGNASLRDKQAIKARITGDLPLALGNGALATRAARLGGRAVLNADVGGTVTTPTVNGTLRLADATLDDPESGLRLHNIAGQIRITESRTTIESVDATSRRGGALKISGEITYPRNGPVGMQISTNLAGLKFDDRRIMAGEIDGTIDVRGTLASLAATGALHLKRLDVTVPSQMPQSVANLELKHVNAPAHLKKPEQDQREPKSNTEAMRVAIDMRINAANRIFVRGRGVDAQLGGDLKVQGTAAHPVADGAFAMQRGRLSILGRQLDFKRGNIFFAGSVEPLLDMEASAPAGDVTVVVTITGSASNPVFKFSSIPELPEDEVVARLLFNKDLAGLSPMQLAQLAGEIDKIGGLSSGPGVFDQLKSSLGIDVLDVGTDQKGDPTVSAGSYVNDKTYIGVRGGTSVDSSRVIIDHELTKSLKARGELGADGNSKVGIGVEWDY